MQSIKLSITIGARLARKYAAADMARIDAAVAAWIAADGARAIRTVHLAIDDAKAMKPYKAAPLKGPVTPDKVKKVLDALVAELSPDYIVLFGAGDIVPFFVVPNPSRSNKDGDDDPSVPTDNPYACSAAFHKGTRASYLVPDRVVGRIPDMLGSSDPSWLLAHLKEATTWTGRKASVYRAGFYLCNQSWRAAGVDCVKTLGLTKADLLISPPTVTASATLAKAQRGLRHMIKCHGSPETSAFFGEKGDDQPESMRSPGLAGRVKSGTVVGAMCCYGASLFSPVSKTAVNAGEPPVPNQYLKLGAYGFLGSSTIAWVGFDDMQCADWIVTSFLKKATSGASTGRAALEAKQDFLRWIAEQGKDPDTGDEKTLLQFMLLGDPSIHPVVATATPAGPVPAGMRAAGVAASAVAAALQAAPAQRAVRRAARRSLGLSLRLELPQRTKTRTKPPQEAERVAQALLSSLPTTRARASARHRWTERVRRRSSPTPTPTGVAAALRRATAASPAAVAPVTGRNTYQYYWVTRQESRGIPRITMVTVHTDDADRVIDKRVLVSS